MAKCPGLDRDALLARVEGDVVLLRKLIEAFLETCPRLLTAIREAITGGDSQALRHAAHALKGVVGEFAAEAAFAAAQQMETIGRHGDVRHAEAAYAVLVEEIDTLTHALRTLEV
jgi:HPt (histidine-containing phosphotransfer) domain-containing protein